MASSDRDVVLLYHRVADVRRDPQELAVSPSHFEEHLSVLREEGYAIVPLEDLTESGRRGKRVALTFDDGYADNLHIAAPLIDKADACATVFVTTSNVEGQREFWWDALEWVAFESFDVPDEIWRRAGLDVPVRGRSEPPAELDSWSLLERFDPTPRHVLYRRLCGLVRTMEPRLRDALVEEFLFGAGSGPVARDTHRPLTMSEVATLSRTSMVVGAHTTDHPVLSRLAVRDQRAQIAGSQEKLTEWVGEPIDSFSYPFGRRSLLRTAATRSRLKEAIDYTSASIRLVREAGFRTACSNTGRALGRRRRELELDRLLVRDCDGDALALQVDRATSGRVGRPRRIV